MAKRIVIEFICDVCARIASFEHFSGSFVGNVFKAHPYPKDWKVRHKDGKTIDVCPDCPMPSIEEVKANG